MEKGQVAVETIFFVIVLFLIMALVFAEVSNQEHLRNAFETNSEELGVCNRLSYMVSSIYSSGKGERVLYFLENNAAIDSNEILVGSTYCSFIGIASNADLIAGNIVLKNLNGTVVLENA